MYTEIEKFPVPNHFKYQKMAHNLSGLQASELWYQEPAF